MSKIKDAIVPDEVVMNKIYYIRAKINLCYFVLWCFCGLMILNKYVARVDIVVIMYKKFH